MVRKRQRPEDVRAFAYAVGASLMDLNYLLHRHQVALMRADRAASPEAACSHAGMARGYERRILNARDLLGAAGRMVAA